MNATFIGGGNMATALIGGLVAGGSSPRDFRVVEPMAAQDEPLRFDNRCSLTDLAIGHQVYKALMRGQYCFPTR